METSQKEEMITIKFNSLVTPKVKWNSKEKKFEAIVSSIDFRHEYAKLIDEEGDTPEETKKLKRMHTRMMSLHEAMNYIYGAMNDKERVQFYYKNDVVTLPKHEAEYYLNQYCGGMAKVKTGEKLVDGVVIPEFKEGPHRHNIDNKQGYYEAHQMARFEREHLPLMVAEIAAA